MSLFQRQSIFYIYINDKKQLENSFLLTAHKYHFPVPNPSEKALKP